MAYTSLLLGAQGKFAHNTDIPRNPEFRFGAQQPDKLRGCYELKDSLTNTACAVLTPAALCGWGHIAETTQICRPTPRTWPFGKRIVNPLTNPALYAPPTPPSL